MSKCLLMAIKTSWDSSLHRYLLNTQNSLSDLVRIIKCFVSYYRIWAIIINDEKTCFHPNNFSIERFANPYSVFVKQTEM